MKPSPVLFTACCVASGVPEPVAEYLFHPIRKWRMDYAWVQQKVALEVEGGVWTGGRHTSSSGFIKDMEKYNAAASLGWRVIRRQPRDLLTAATIDLIRTTLNPETT